VDNSLTEILSQLGSRDPHKRAVALAVAGRLRLHTLIDKMIFALEDDNEEVRATAAWALDLVGSPVIVPALVKALYDRSFTVRSNAGWALVHLGQRMIGQLVVPDVIEVLRDHAFPEAQQMAYLVLSRIGGKDAEEAINHYRK
jgi:HEAT repeat protein